MVEQIIKTAGHIPLEGARNFRDLGGLPTCDGGRVKTGLLFRSDGLQNLTANDLKKIAAIGIRLVIDLRSAKEREQHPSRWPEELTTEFVHFEINDRNGGFIRLLREDSTASGARQAMFANYRSKSVSFGPVFPLLFRRLCDPQSLPTLIHCHAGKDRTGFAIALILIAIGVPRQAVVADYAVTARLWNDEETIRAFLPVLTKLTGRPATADAAQMIYVADPAYLETGLLAIEEGHGSVDGYLNTALGLNDADRQRLKQSLVEYH